MQQEATRSHHAKKVSCSVPQRAPRVRDCAWAGLLPAVHLSSELLLGRVVTGASVWTRQEDGYRP